MHFALASSILMGSITCTIKVKPLLLVLNYISFSFVVIMQYIWPDKGTRNHSPLFLNSDSVLPCLCSKYENCQTFSFMSKPIRTQWIYEMYIFMLNTLHLYNGIIKSFVNVKCKPELKSKYSQNGNPIYFLMHIRGLVVKDSSVHVLPFVILNRIVKTCSSFSFLADVS